MNAAEQTHYGYVSGFRTTLDHKAMASRISVHPEFRSSPHDRQDDSVIWFGMGPQESRVEIWSQAEEDLLGLAISVRAQVYFDIRKTIHEVLEAKLVVNSALEEILATYDAGRDILELDGQNLTELPPQIGMLSDLEVLSLSNNRLTCLPAEIGRLSKVVELALDGNNLTELTPQIGRLTHLKTLLLSHNRLGALPASIGDLTNLRTLNLDHNQLRRLPPEIGRLENLRRLKIQDNLLTEMPVEFAQLDRLRDPDLKNWNFRKGLPPGRNFMASQNSWVYPPAEIMTERADVIREYLKANPIDRRRPVPYVVLVDDNYHHMDKTYRYKLGAFADCQSAVEACKKIVDEFFVAGRDCTAQELFDSYRRFGEDPFILTSDRNCVFSAWKYAEQRCRELAAGAIELGGSGLDNPLLTGDGMNQERWASGPYSEIQSEAIPRSPPPSPASLPRIISSCAVSLATRSLTDYTFELTIDVAAAMQPTLEANLRKEFPEIWWENRAENPGEIRVEGISRNAPRSVAVSIVRNESHGPLTFGLKVGATEHSEVEESYNEFMRRLTWTLIGWTQFRLPQFRRRPALGVDVDQEMFVGLAFPLDGRLITLGAMNLDIIISRTFLEALSLHLEVLDPWVKTLSTEICDELETRATLERGRSARVILRQSTSIDGGQDLQAPLVLVRPAHSFIGELLELGLAKVVLYGAGGRAPGAPSISPRSIRVHYGSRSGTPEGLGYISYSAADGESSGSEEFLRIEWR